MLDGRNNRLFFPGEQMFFLMQIIFIVLPSYMAAVQNLYTVFVHEMFAIGRGLFSVFSCELVQLPKNVAYILNLHHTRISFIVLCMKCW